MQILHIISNLGRGGAESTLLKVISGDLKNNHKIISLKKGGQLRKNFISQNIELFELQTNLYNPFSFLKIFRIIKKINPDLIQTWMYHSDLIGSISKMFYGYKCIWCVRSGILDYNFNNFKTIITRKLCVYLSKKYVDKIIYCSYNSMHFHHKLGYSNGKSVLINNGYDSNFFKHIPNIKSDFIKKNKINKDIFILGIIGRIHEQKNHIFFLNLINNLIKRNQEIFALIIYPEMKEILKNKLDIFIYKNNLEKNIIFVDGSHNINSYINILDLNILCSSWGEAFPNVICETMLCKVPNISYDIGDASIIIKNNDHIISELNTELFEMKILKFLNLKKNFPNEWSTIKENARNNILKNYKISDMIKKFQKTWDNYQ